MGKYYNVCLNCAREKSLGYGEFYYGYIKCFPNHEIEHISWLDGGIYYVGNRRMKVDYNSLGYVIAELIGDHFEDIILGKKIYYDSNGISDTNNLDSYSTEELETEKDKPLTCFSYYEAPTESIANFLKGIKDKRMLNKYKQEIQFMENKMFIREELNKRYQIERQANRKRQEDLKIIEEFERSRKGR